MHTTFKRMELESPGCSGFEANIKSLDLQSLDFLVCFNDSVHHYTKMKMVFSGTRRLEIKRVEIEQVETDLANHFVKKMSIQSFEFFNMKNNVFHFC